MRLFVAAELSPHVRAAAAACGAQLRDRLERARAADGIRWTPPANLHLTVWFLGDVSEPRAAAVLDALRPPLLLPAFDVHIAGFGVFPPAGAPRVIWMGLIDGRTELARAHDRVGERLQPWGFGPEVRAYSAHLTIARVKDQRGRARAALRQAVTHQPGDAGRCRVRELTVFQSRTSTSGAVYEPLLRVPLE